jgi:alkanesulfonate monooxygenase SsuD/methylene tetrahydromethanopterin reductase-like flavin-dependent oxidoreductase (luciferase family)
VTVPPTVQFGLNVDPHAAGVPIAERIAGIADDAGLDLVGVQDHPYLADHLDTFALLAWLAGRTRSVRLFSNVANLPLRPPAMLAKQAATIDVLSGGRFELGLGAGAFTDAIVGMGGPRRARGPARAALSEAVDVIRASWAGRGYSHQGEHYALPSVRPGPRPAHEIGVWLGVLGPRSVRLVGAKADGWSVSSSYVAPARLTELNATITGAAEEAGRDPAALVRLYNVAGRITDGGPEGAGESVPADEPGAVQGPPRLWVDVLSALHVERGMNAFVFWPDGDRERQSRRFAEEVVPELRARLAAGG